MKKKLGIVLAVVATAVSLVGCAKPDTDLKTPTAQTDALMDVQANQADIAIVDGVFAGYTLAQEGNSYDKLTIIELEDFKPEAESYGVAAKKGKTKLMNFKDFMKLKIPITKKFAKNTVYRAEQLNLQHLQANGKIGRAKL